MTTNDEKSKRTKKELSQEIDLRERSITKFGTVLAPLQKAVRELEKRLEFEQQKIDELTEELKGME